MSLSSSPTTAAAAPDADRDPMSSLWDHRRHVFIFTRAGKPVFALHGQEERLSPLFALFQVLLSMNDDEEEEDGVALGGASSTSNTAPDEVRQVVYYQSRPHPSRGGADEVQALTLFFYVQGELMYVMAQRTAAPGSPLQRVTADVAQHMRCASTAPPVASYCAAQLRHLHHAVLLVLPNISTLLLRQPSCDVLSIFTESDRAALRELLESYACRLTYAVGAMATLSLTVEKRRIVESALLRSFRCAVDPDVPPPSQQLFSLLFYRDALLAAVGPPESYAAAPSEADKVAPLALGAADACCGGLPIDDALLLYRYARSLVKRQVGEAWAPVCLPRFNSTGYLWCYAVNFSRHIRDLRGERGLSVWPPLWTEKSEQDVLLLHVSAGQDDFTALSRCTRRFAQLLYSPTVGDNFYYRLEEELCYRTPAPLTELLGSLHATPQRQQQQQLQRSEGSGGGGDASLSSLTPPPSPSLSSKVTGVPLWYGLVLHHGDPNFLNSDAVAETHTGTAAAAAVAAAAMRHLPRCTADVRLLFECQPSPLLNLTTQDDVGDFYQAVTRYQAQLRATPPSSSAPSLLLVRHSSTAAFAVMQPTMATLTTLAQCFFSTKAPFDLPILEDGGSAFNGIDVHRGGVSEEPSASRRGASFSAWAEAVKALGVVELTVVFPAATPETLVWYWVARVLFMAVQRRARFVVRQRISSKSS